MMKTLQTPTKDATKEMPSEPGMTTPTTDVKASKRGTKRARMGTERTPDGNSGRKRKPPTRARTLKDMLNTSSPSVIKEEKAKEEAKEKIEVTAPVTAKENTPATSVTATMSAVKALGTGPGPSARWGHSMCLLDEFKGIVIGGQGGQGERQTYSKDSIWQLDIETRKWSVPDTLGTGQKPEHRMGHTAVYDPMVRCIYLYGGSKNNKWFSDVHMLDLDEWKWQVVQAEGKAPTRSYHSATLYRHEIWIFGGVFPCPDPQPDGCSNDVHVFSPLQEGWYSPIVMGEKPCPRSGHSTTLLRDRLVMFGGWDSPVCFNDLYVLDMTFVEWSQPKISGSPPLPRSWHASCALSGNRVLIHGGYNGNNALSDAHIFNLDTLSWTSIQLEPSIQARAGHTALCLPYRHDNEEKDEVYIFAGGDNDGAFFQDLKGLYIPFETKAIYS